MIWNNPNLIKVLNGNGIVVMPTDTLYGIVGKAQNISVVNRIYAIRKRNPEKPCIILIGDVNELEKFSITLSEEQKNKIKEYWPFDHTQNFQLVPTSIVLDCPDNSFFYLHRGTKTLAFRLPVPTDLQNLLKKTGPLIAPSANLEGWPPAEDISKAKEYFGSLVDLYVDGGIIKSKASKVIKLHRDGSVDVLRF
jgi:L-threonylcarbamoyladenylate synthase